MASDLRPGWYWVRSEDSDQGFPLFRTNGERELDIEEGWIIGGDIMAELPPSWTVIARLEDLLHDAERYRVMKTLIPGDEPWDVVLDAEIAREKERPDG